MQQGFLGERLDGEAAPDPARPSASRWTLRPLPTLLGFLAVTPEGRSACLNLGVPPCKWGPRAAPVEAEQGEGVARDAQGTQANWPGPRSLNPTFPPARPRDPHIASDHTGGSKTGSPTTSPAELTPHLRADVKYPAVPSLLLGGLMHQGLVAGDGHPVHSLRQLHRSRAVSGGALAPQPLAHRPGPHLPPGPHFDFAGTQPAAGPGKTPAPPARRPAPSAPGPAPAAPTPAAPARSAPWCRHPRTHRGRDWAMEGQQEEQGSALSAQCWPVAGGRVDSRPGAGQGGNRAPPSRAHERRLHVPPSSALQRPGRGPADCTEGIESPWSRLKGGFSPTPTPPSSLGAELKRGEPRGWAAVLPDLGRVQGHHLCVVQG